MALSRQGGMDPLVAGSQPKLMGEPEGLKNARKGNCEGLNVL